LNPNELYDRAMVALEEQNGKWHCAQCWANAAGLTSPEDQQRLSALARTFIGTTDPVATRGGTCDIGEHSTSELVVRILPRQKVASRY